MKLNDYQSNAVTTAIYPSEKGMEYTALGLASEAGEVASIVSKWIRGDKENINKTDIAKELGDVLWFVAMMAHELDMNLSTIATINLDKLLNRQNKGTLQGDGDNRMVTIPMNKGIDIETTAEWLNTSKSYCYRLVKWGQLQTVSTDPVCISPKSVIEFIGKKYPKIIDLGGINVRYS